MKKLIRHYEEATCCDRSNQNYKKDCHAVLRRLAMTVYISLTFFSLISCTTEITVKQNKDNSVDVQFSAAGGDAFAKMLISSFDASENPDNAVLDEQEITAELTKAGFSNINVKSSKLKNVKIDLSDKNKSSYLFTSGILNDDKGKLSLQINAQTLKDFYNSADEQVLNILDLFIAPVFNDEQMTEEEYLEMLGTFYGKNISEEIRTSKVKIILINQDGTKESKEYSFPSLLTKK